GASASSLTLVTARRRCQASAGTRLPPYSTSKPPSSVRSKTVAGTFGGPRTLPSRRRACPRNTSPKSRKSRHEKINLYAGCSSPKDTTKDQRKVCRTYVSGIRRRPQCPGLASPDGLRAGGPMPWQVTSFVVRLWRRGDGEQRVQ